VIRTCEAGHAPTRVLSGARCPACARKREASRPSREARGYGREHAAARAVLLTMLPTPCGYGCGRVLATPEDLVAAHRVDGDPSAGWMAACRSCNERAKQRGGGGDRPQDGRGGATPAPGNPGSARVSSGFSGFRQWVHSMTADDLEAEAASATMALLAALVPPRRCPACGAELPYLAGPGRPRRWCDAHHPRPLRLRPRRAGGSLQSEA
jgi:hypothetical protein